MELIDTILQRASGTGLRLADERLHIRIPGAADVLRGTMQAVCRGRFVWHPEYERVADWLADNGRRGLLLMGTCGVGKSLLCEKVLPAVVGAYTGRWFHVCRAVDLGRDFDALSRYQLLTIDDIGTEPPVVKDFGTPHAYLCELLDLAEKHDKTLLLTTNLTWHELVARYGQRIDRLRSLCRIVVVRGKSHRGDEQAASSGEQSGTTPALVGSSGAVSSEAVSSGAVSSGGASSGAVSSGEQASKEEGGEV